MLPFCLGVRGVWHVELNKCPYKVLTPGDSFGMFVNSGPGAEKGLQFLVRRRQPFSQPLPAKRDFSRLRSGRKDNVLPLAKEQVFHLERQEDGLGISP